MNLTCLHQIAFLTAFRPPQSGLGTSSAHAPDSQLPNATLSDLAHPREPVAKVGKRAAAGVS